VEAPQAYKNAGIGNLAGGIITVLASLSGLLATMCFGLTFFLSLAAGAFQAYVGFQMYQGQVSPQAKVGTIVGIVGAVFSCNPISLLAGGWAFMQLGDDQVAGWLEQNGVG